MDEVLNAGSGANRGRVVRRGDTVIRPAGPHTAAVHALLRHLRAEGLHGAPEPLGIEGDSELLRFIPGEVPVPPEPPHGGWPVVPDVSLVSVGDLLRLFHDAAFGFDSPSAAWQGGGPEPFDGDRICHNDPVVGNIVFRQGRAVALIDFDYAGPSDPVWDVAIAAQHWVPLADPADLVGDNLDRWEPGQRLGIFCNAYRLPPSGAGRLLDAVEHYLSRGHEEVERRVEAGEAAFVAYWQAGLGDRLRRASDWLRSARPSLDPLAQ